MGRFGLELEARLLSQYAGHGPCTATLEDGTVVHVGPQLPRATFGDRWLDTCELSLMVFLPFYVAPKYRDLEVSEEVKARRQENRSWFGLHPVRRYQFGAFLDVARLEPDRGAFDRARLLLGNATDVITRIRCGEASAYLYWFGKQFAGENQWQSIKETLGLAPWSTPAREWLSESHNDDTQNDALSPDGIHTYDTEEAPAEVTFRTAVTRGLTTADVISDFDPYAGRVLGRFHRPRATTEP